MSPRLQRKQQKRNRINDISLSEKESIIDEHTKKDKASKEEELIEIDQETMVILNRLLGETFEVRLHAEKKCKEKEYELRSN